MVGFCPASLSDPRSTGRKDEPTMAAIPELEAIRKTQILDAALNTIATNGHANVTMDDICKAAGLSKGGLAHYFKSKETLFRAAFTAFFDRIFQRSQETMTAIDDPMDQLLSFDWLYNLEDPDLNIGYPIVLDVMSIAAHDETYRTIFHDWINNWITLLEGALRKGMAKGLFMKLDPEATARTISAIYQGIATRWYLDPESHSTEWAITSFKQTIKGLMQPYLTQPQP
jgi:AcrR family transcriptional regulator